MRYKQLLVDEIIGEIIRKQLLVDHSMKIYLGRSGSAVCGSGG